MSEDVIVSQFNIEEEVGTYCIQEEESNLHPLTTHSDIRSVCNPRGLPNPHHVKTISREKAENKGLEVCKKCKSKNGESQEQ